MKVLKEDKVFIHTYFILTLIILLVTIVTNNISWGIAVAIPFYYVLKYALK